MGRPRKIVEPETKRSDEWKFYFAAAMSGLIARGGMSEEMIMKVCKHYADEAEKAANG